MSEIQNRIEGTLCPKCEGSFLRGQVAAKVKGKYYHKDCIKQNKVAGETAGKTGETAGESRDEQGRFMPGASGNPKGGNSQTEEEKLVKKAIKELVKEYQETLAEALPKLSPVLIKKALEGDIASIKEVNDRTMGKAPQRTDITSGDKPIPILGVVVKEDKEEGNGQK